VSPAKVKPKACYFETLLIVTIRASENRPRYPSASFVNPSARSEIFLEPSLDILPWTTTLLRRLPPRGNWGLRAAKSKRYPVPCRSGSHVCRVCAERKPEEEDTKTNDATLSTTDNHSDPWSCANPVSLRSDTGNSEGPMQELQLPELRDRKPLRSLRS
jgi:hypothetical protein